MHQLSSDHRDSWSHYAWRDITKQIPPMLFQGLRTVMEMTLMGLDPFYASMLCSYVMVNDLFYKRNKHMTLPVNLWGHPLAKQINYGFTTSGFFTVADLPTIWNKINFQQIQSTFENPVKSAFLTCYALQNKFSKFFGNSIFGSHIVLEKLLNQSKSLLHEHNSEMLSLTQWEVFFGLMLLSKGEKEMVFKRMLEKCSYLKFREINFKMLSHILILPKVLSAVWKKPDLSHCPWCSGQGTLEHYLFSCIQVVKLRKKILRSNKELMLPWSNCVWCFGALKSKLNPIVWVVNFGIYKTML